MPVNLMPNPNFATDTSGWGASAGAVVTQVTDADFTPGTAMQIVATDANEGAGAPFAQEVVIPGLGMYEFNLEHQSQAGTLDTWYVTALAVDASHNGLGNETMTGHFFTPGASVAIANMTVDVDTPGAVGIRFFILKVNSTGESTARLSAMELYAPDDGATTRRIRRQFQLRPY